MAKFFQRLLSLILVLAMCASIPLPALATEAAAEKAITSNLINKVASGLDANDQTNVTLTVPGEKIDLTSDIVFILGHGPSSNYGYIVDMIHKMLVAVDGTPTKIKIGMVGFANTTEEETVLPLTEMKDTVPENTVAEYRLAERGNDGKKYTEPLEDYLARKAEFETNLAVWEKDEVLKTDMEYIIARALDAASNVYMGVNLESSLITARDMLAADKDVPADRKHMIVISTGLAYYFDNDKGQASTILGTNKFGNYMHGNKYWVVARNGRTSTDYGYNIPAWALVKKDGVVDYAASWKNFWENYVLGWIEADQNRFVYDMNGQNYREFLTSDTGTLYGKNYNEYPPGVNKSDGTRFGYALTDPEDIAAVKEAIPYFAVPGDGGTILSENAKHAMNYERGQYEALMIYRQMETDIGESVTTLLKDENGNNITLPGLGFNCYAIAIGKSVAEGEEDVWLTSSSIGYNFMRMMGGENTVNYRDGDTSFFKSIENKILYTCAPESYVEDFMGYNVPNLGNFDFIQDPDTLKLIVGGVPYTTAQVETKKGATASYAFTKKDASEATFWLDYYIGNGTTTERFVWTFGENVSLENRASLTYRLQLTGKTEEAGKYKVETNLSATLHPKDSKGNWGEPAVFPVPFVEYEVVPYDVDIVIALGAGIANKDNTYDSILNLVAPLLKQGIKVKLGLVAVEHYDDVAMDLTLLPKTDYEKVIKENLDKIVAMPVGPTNLEGNILAAHRMLAADKSVPNENKFFYVIATGRTYCFDDANGNPATIVNQVSLKGQKYYYWGHYLWQSQRGRHTSLYMVPSRYQDNWDAYWADVTAWVEKDGDQFVYSFPAYDTTNENWYKDYFAANTKDAKALGLASSRFGWIFKNPAIDASQPAIGSGANPDHALNYERGQYDAYMAYKAMLDAGYTCYALCSESTSYQNGSPYINIAKYTGGTTLQLGHSFMNFLAKTSAEHKAGRELTAAELEALYAKSLLFVMTDPNTGASEMATNFFAPINVSQLKKTETKKNPPVFATGPKQPALQITEQPVDTYAAVGEVATVSVAAKGEGLKYQWYFKNAGATKFSKSSIKSATYTTTMTAARANRELYCVITDANGNTVITETVKLVRVAKEALEIIEQPVDTSAAKGDAISVSVAAKGEGLKYQWYFKNAGATKFSKSSIKSATYTTTMTAAVAGRQVYCVITDALGNTVTTETVTLVRVAKEELAIIAQPTDVYAAKGENVSTTVAAKGEGLKYQWYFKNAGATTFTKSSLKAATYSTSMSAAVAGRQVYCVITDALGNTVKTETVTLYCGTQG